MLKQGGGPEIGRLPCFIKEVGNDLKKIFYIKKSIVAKILKFFNFSPSIQIGPLQYNLESSRPALVFFY